MTTEPTELFETIYGPFRNYLRSKSLFFRKKSLEKMEDYQLNLDKPVTSWIKEDRIISGKGYEFTIILKTCACRWANSLSGGCTMCGYFNDKGPDDISQQNILNQIDYAFSKQAEQIKQISDKNEKISLKIFTSGSFFDDKELTEETRLKICNKINNFPCITECVVESRPEFISESCLRPIMNTLSNKTFEVGIGLESSNKYVREILINKGFGLEQFKNAVHVLHQNKCRVKTYLLLKPPFLSEKIAIRDAIQSIKDVIALGTDSISVNPVNVQKYTLVDKLFNENRYRPPWIYSIIEVFRQALSQDILKSTLILCDPSAAGNIKGTHNCEKKECNAKWLGILREFVYTQDYSLLEKNRLPYGSCSCYDEYSTYLDLQLR